MTGYGLDDRGAIIGRGDNSSLRHHCGKTGTGIGITIVQILCVSKSSVLVSRKIRFRKQNVPVFQAIIIGMLTMRRNILLSQNGMKHQLDSESHQAATNWKEYERKWQMCIWVITEPGLRLRRMRNRYEAKISSVWVYVIIPIINNMIIIIFNFFVFVCNNFFISYLLIILISPLFIAWGVKFFFQPHLNVNKRPVFCF